MTSRGCTYGNFSMRMEVHSNDMAWCAQIMRKLHKTFANEAEGKPSEHANLFHWPRKFRPSRFTFAVCPKHPSTAQRPNPVGPITKLSSFFMLSVDSDPHRLNFRLYWQFNSGAPEKWWILAYSVIKSLRLLGPGNRSKSMASNPLSCVSFGSRPVTLRWLEYPI